MPVLASIFSLYISLFQQRSYISLKDSCRDVVTICLMKVFGSASLVKYLNSTLVRGIS